jgi:hypothetical protein
MTNERIPEDPYRSTFARDELRNPAALDNELQPDPELAEGPASGSRVAMFAVGVAVVLGAVFYGLNNSSVEKAGTSPTAQNASPVTPAQNPAPPPQSTAQNSAQPAPTAAPPGMRDVTPRANTDAGVTTGAAPARPATPPSTAPTGQDASRAGSPATNTAPANK